MAGQASLTRPVQMASNTLPHTAHTVGDKWVECFSTTFSLSFRRPECRGKGQIAEEILILKKRGRILRQEWSRQKSPSSSLPVNFTSGSSGVWMAHANPREILFLDSFPVSGLWRRSGGGGGRASFGWFICVAIRRTKIPFFLLLLALRRFIFCWLFF